MAWQSYRYMPLHAVTCSYIPLHTVTTSPSQSYTQYRNIFPMWALARFARHYGPKMEGAALEGTSKAKAKNGARPKASPKRQVASPKRKGGK